MPFKTVGVEAELLLTHGGVSVYYTYENDDIDQGRNRYWYTTHEFADDAEYRFDVRDLDSAYLLDEHPPYLQGEHDTLENRAAWQSWHEVGEPDAIRSIIVASIDAGLIEDPEAP
jgi:hypothetical protein